MTKKNSIEKVNDINNFDTIQNELNDELVTKKKKDKSENPYYLFVTFVIKRLREDKLYLISFIITLLTVIVFSIFKVQDAEGYYEKNKPVNNASVSTNVDNSNKSDVTLELDVSDYVGIYSKEFSLESSLVLSDTCSINSYKLVYQVKKDKSIIKYFVNDCVGNIKIWSDKLDYVSNGGARYISANDINFLFSTNHMKEAYGDTFNIDDDISSIKEKKLLKDYDTSFLGTNIILHGNKELIAIKGNKVSFKLTDNYVSNGGGLDKLVYKSSIKNQYNFIVFANEENANCYGAASITVPTFNDGINYKIYTIKFNTEKDSFNDPKEIISRNKVDGCNLFNEDLETLKE